MAAVVAGMVFAPLVAAAQTAPKVFRVGYLAFGGRTPDGAPPRALRESLRQLGFVDGQNVAYETRFAEGRRERLANLAAELVRLKVDLLVTQGGQATVAARQATSTIPIVMAVAAGDAVATGLIASLAHPGGNITGLTDEVVQLSAKRMQLLKEALPKAKRIAVLWNANDQGMTLRYQEIEKAARVLSVEVQAHGVREPDDFDAAFAAMARRRPDGMFLVADGLTTMYRKRLVDFAAAQRIPAMYESAAIVREGGLMSYGPDLNESFQRAAIFVARILKGEKPADLPAEQPTKYSLAVNLKTATTLGLVFPQSLIIRTDDVVQ